MLRVGRGLSQCVYPAHTFNWQDRMNKKHWWDKKQVLCEPRRYLQLVDSLEVMLLSSLEHVPFQKCLAYRSRIQSFKTGPMAREEAWVFSLDFMMKSHASFHLRNFRLVVPQPWLSLSHPSLLTILSHLLHSPPMSLPQKSVLWRPPPIHALRFGPPYACMASYSSHMLHSWNWSFTVSHTGM